MAAAAADAAPGTPGRDDDNFDELWESFVVAGYFRRPDCEREAIYTNVKIKIYTYLHNFGVHGTGIR